MTREYILSRQHEVDQAELLLKQAQRNYRDALKDVRDGCPHAGTAVELRFHADDRDNDLVVRRTYAMARFCLECGEMERCAAKTLPQEAPPPIQAVVTHRATRVFRTDYGADGMKYLLAFECYKERLHDAARFDEFDAEGRWIAAEGRLIRGED